MNNDIVKKNIEYQEKIREIAKILFHAFYYDEEALLDAIDYETYVRIGTADLMEKSDKFFQFFNNLEDAKATIRYLKIVNPKKAKEIIEEM